MLKKSQEILARYRFLTEQLSNPETIADMPLWQKYSKEQAELRETAEKYEEYLAVEREMNDAFAAAEEETDVEMKKMLVDEGYACKERLQVIVGELKILLLPKDKNDEKNCILEVRAGTGGEEAALFGAELFRIPKQYFFRFYRKQACFEDELLFQVILSRFRAATSYRYRALTNTQIRQLLCRYEPYQKSRPCL